MISPVPSGPHCSLPTPKAHAYPGSPAALPPAGQDPARCPQRWGEAAKARQGKARQGQPGRRRRQGQGAVPYTAQAPQSAVEAAPQPGRRGGLTDGARRALQARPANRSFCGQQLHRTHSSLPPFLPSKAHSAPCPPYLWPAPRLEPRPHHRSRHPPRAPPPPPPHTAQARRPAEAVGKKWTGRPAQMHAGSCSPGEPARWRGCCSGPLPRRSGALGRGRALRAWLPFGTGRARLAPWGFVCGCHGSADFPCSHEYPGPRESLMASPGSGHRHPPGAVRPRGGGCSGRGDQSCPRPQRPALRREQRGWGRRGRSAAAGRPRLPGRRVRALAAAQAEPGEGAPRRVCARLLPLLRLAGKAAAE